VAVDPVTENQIEIEVKSSGGKYIIRSPRDIRKETGVSMGKYLRASDKGCLLFFFFYFIFLFFLG